MASSTWCGRRPARSRPSPGRPTSKATTRSPTSRPARARPKEVLRHLLFGVALCAALGAAHALTPDEAKAIAVGEPDARIEALNKAVVAADDKTAAFLQALADDAVKTAGGRVFIVKD